MGSVGPGGPVGSAGTGVEKSSMKLTPKFHWMFRIRSAGGHRGRVVHLAASAEDGSALSTTICGKSYDPADRMEASRGLEPLRANLCAGCRAQLGETFDQLKTMLVNAGMSESEAIAQVDVWLKLRRDSK